MARPPKDIPNTRTPAAGKGLALDQFGLVPANAMGSGSTGTDATSLWLRADRSWVAPPGAAKQVAIAASNTTYSSGTISLTGVGGGITVSSNTGQRVDLSVAAQSVQPGVQQLVASNASFSSGTVSISGFGAATINTQASMIRVSVPTQTAQTGISSIAASNATYTSGQVQFTGVGGGVTVSSNTGQRVDISVAAPVAQTVQTQNVHNVTLSAGIGGSTSGTLAEISSGTMTLVAGQNVTITQNSGNKVEIKVPTQTVQTQSNIQGLANSQTTYQTGTAYLSEQANITINSSVNGASQYYRFSVAAGGAAPTLSRWNNMACGGATASIQTLLGTNNGTMNVFPLAPVEDAFAGNMTVSTVLFNMSLASANTSAQSWTFSFGVYTEANSTALSMLYQATTAVANAAATNNTTGWHGMRWLSLHSSLFSNSAGVATTPSFANGSVYMGAFVCKSGGQTKGASMIGQSFHASDARSGTLGAAAAAATSLMHYPWNGIYSSGSLPTAITKSSVNAGNASSPFVPFILFENNMTAL